MGNISNTELLDFTGGMNTVTAPHLLPMNEALELTNVDIRYGSLKSIASLDTNASAQGKFFVEYRSKLYYYNDWRSNALIDDKLYWSNGVDTGKILPDGTELPLGIATPVNAPVQTLSGTVGTGVHKGDYKYTYTFYSTTTGVESAPAKLPSYISPDEQNVSISGLDALPANADKYRIYRIGGYLTQFTLVDTIDAVDLPYIDSIDDSLIDGRLLYTLRSGTPPAGVKNFVELNGRLFGSVENRVYFSGLGNPDAWYTDDFFNLPNEVIALAKVPAGLLVLGRGYVYLLFGASPTSFRTKVVSDYLGCITNKSIAYYNERVIWLGIDGIMTSDGYSVQNLTYRKIDSITSMNISSAAVANDVYYMSFTPLRVPSTVLVPSNDLYPGRVRGASLEDKGFTEGMIALDFRRGNQYSYIYLAHSNVTSLGIYKGELYLTIDGTREPILCEHVFPCNTVFCYGEQILAKLGSSIGTTYKQLTYISPQLIDGSYATLKEYDKVRINFRGKFKVTIIFANLTNVIETEIDSPNIITNELELLADADSVAVIGIPNNNNKSYSIQFKVEGVGIVKSIQYSWSNRELP